MDEHTDKQQKGSEGAQEPGVDAFLLGWANHEYYRRMQGGRKLWLEHAMYPYGDLPSDTDFKSLIRKGESFEEMRLGELREWIAGAELRAQIVEANGC